MKNEKISAKTQSSTSNIPEWKTVLTASKRKKEQNKEMRKAHLCGMTWDIDGQGEIL